MMVNNFQKRKCVVRYLSNQSIQGQRNVAADEYLAKPPKHSSNSFQEYSIDFEMHIAACHFIEKREFEIKHTPKLFLNIEGVIPTLRQAI